MSLTVTSASSLFKIAAPQAPQAPQAPATDYGQWRYKSSPPNIENMTPEKAQAYYESYDPNTKTIQVGRVRRRVDDDYYRQLEAKSKTPAPSPDPAAPAPAGSAADIELEPAQVPNKAPWTDTSMSSGYSGTSNPWTSPGMPGVTDYPQKPDYRNQITKPQLDALLKDPQKAEQTIKMYEQYDPEFAKKLRNTLEMNKSPNAGATDADPATPGFQAPEWANPEMSQRMQQMYEQNQRNNKFNEWASQAAAQGFTPQQIEELRQQHAQMPQTQQPQQPQQSQTQPLGREFGQGAGKLVRSPWEAAKGFWQGLKGQSDQLKGVASTIPLLTAYASSAKKYYLDK